MYREAIYNEISSKVEKKRSNSRNLNLKNLTKQYSKSKGNGQPSLGNKYTKTSEVNDRNFLIKESSKKKKKL